MRQVERKLSKVVRCGSNPSAAADSRTAVGISCRPVAVFRTIGSRLYKNRAKIAVTGLIPKNGSGTSNASKARDGIVWITLVVERMKLLTGPGRLARMPSGMPTIIPRKSEAPTNSKCRNVQRPIFPIRLLEGETVLLAKVKRRGKSVIFRPLSFRV